jgi:lipopolysaccharide export system protein LptA
MHKSQNLKDRTQIKTKILLLVFLSSVFCLLSSVSLYAQETQEKIEPIIVNGDNVEYSSSGKEVTASGNVEVIYKGTRLTCDKLTVNTQTKDGRATGHARLDDTKGVIEGQVILYNFQTKSGTILESAFRANPYFGRAKDVQRVDEQQFIARKGYFTTCSFEHPHYRIASNRVKMFPGDKIETEKNTFYVGDVPLAYLPQYDRSLKDPLMHVQVMPGKSREWGLYTLSAWRYNLTPNINGRIYADYRSRKGVAEGLGANYAPPGFGKGDFKYYYTHERDHCLDKTNRNPRIFQRYFIRNRHQWDIDERTKLTSEYYKIVDSKRMIHGSDYNFLKDYFPREYEIDSLPLSYNFLHHSFDYASLDILLQKRTNRWYTQGEKLPEITYSLPSLQIGETPFYFQNSSSYLSYNSKTAVPSESWEDVYYNQLSTTNRFSLPTRISFISLTPFVSGEDTYIDKSTYGATQQTTFSGGTQATTKFYRIFNVKDNFLGLDIHGLRHIITPTASYTYSQESAMPASKARIGGRKDTVSSSFPLGLNNKLQTKRKTEEVDLANLDISTTYSLKPPTGSSEQGASFGNVLFDLELLPYSWMRVDLDATFDHSVSSRYSVPTNYRHFSIINYDFSFDFDKGRSFGFGQRYQRKGGNQITYNLDWKLNPKWNFRFYHRLEHGHDYGLRRGLREQEYGIIRDLHCWVLEINYNVKRGSGETIWLVFRLKAFPEMEFGYDQTYHQPKPGSQSNP